QPLSQRLHRRVVFVAEALLENVADAPGGGQVEPAVIEHRGVQHRGIKHHRAPSPVRAPPAWTSSSAWTTIDSSSGPPNVVAIATSSASRPRPITIRPLRRMLLRGSKVHQRSPSQTSIQAAKSMGSGLSGTSRSGRYPKT